MLCLSGGWVCHTRSAGAATLEELRAALTSKLTEYCIPSKESGCSDEERAYYNETKGKCECPCDDMMYNQTTRSCEECVETGSFDRFSTRCHQVACIPGYKVVDIADGCPAGHYTIETPRLCGFGLAELERGCPTGHEIGNGLIDNGQLI
jgi:hypothetical protein